ncbi:MAG: hypothetical protein P9L97_00345 [Candidatus Tenebribacter davisii]|jgi:hypothetical protein|nr:hypothetical protein [Candidatus Tenebribacter davisii]
MKKNKTLFCILISFIIIITTGCIGFSDPISRGISRGIGRAVSERAENEAYRRTAPKEKLPPPRSANWGNFMAMQARIVFTYAFSAGGLWLGKVDYTPGEWAKFEINTDSNDILEMERAFLKVDEKGNVWWRISWIEGEDTWLYETLISPSGSLLRLRAKDADGNEGEIPVSGEQIYYPPQEVTKESIEGATVGKASLKTKAGVFNCDHVVYMAVYGQGNVEWWISTEIPGGIAQYQIVDKGEVLWKCTVIAKGKGATTVLGSF